MQTIKGVVNETPQRINGQIKSTVAGVVDQNYNPESKHAQSGIAVSQAVKTLQTESGTVVSQNADFAEVAEWADGNPNNEDRTGYFVCANVPVDGIVMKKATSIDDVKGVTILSPAFAGNYTKDKLDSNGNLLPKYSFVAIIGFVPVIDNGTCTVGGRCMPDDNGCAIPSSNSMGYQVVNRIDENRVLIIIEPNGDMVQRVKTKINKLQEDVDNLEEALADVGGGEKPWTLLNDITLTEAVSRIDEGMYDTNYDEIWVEGLVNFETDYGTTTKTCLFFLSFTARATSHTEYWGSVTNGRQEYFRAYLHRSPSGCAIADTVHSPNYYVSQNPKQTAGANDLIVRKFDQCLISVGEESGKTGVRFGAGTKFKVWGR